MEKCCPAYDVAQYYAFGGVEPCVVQQNCALAQTPIIPVELVQQSLGGTQAKLPSFDEARDEFTRSYLSQILQITGGSVSQAARLAKRNRTDFYKLLGRHQLVPDDFKDR